VESILFGLANAPGAIQFTSTRNIPWSCDNIVLSKAPSNLIFWTQFQSLFVKLHALNNRMFPVLSQNRFQQSFAVHIFYNFTVLMGHSLSMSYQSLLRFKFRRVTAAGTNYREASLPPIA
jgi:hypothetical protein